MIVLHCFKPLKHRFHTHTKLCKSTIENKKHQEPFKQNQTSDMPSPSLNSSSPFFLSSLIVWSTVFNMIFSASEQLSTVSEHFTHDPSPLELVCLKIFFN